MFSSIAGKGDRDHLVGDLECQVIATHHYSRRQWEAIGDSEMPSNQSRAVHSLEACNVSCPPGQGRRWGRH